MEKRVSKFAELEPLPIQIDKTVPQAGKDIVYARELLSVIGLDPSEGSTPINSGAPIIGAGGITSKDSAMSKLHCGSDLLQLYTGLVYNGTNLIKEITSNIK